MGKYTKKQLDTYADKVLQTIEAETKIADLKDRIVYKKLFCVDDFEQRYNSFKGTGLGLAHTLRQTAVFRPKNVSKKVKNLYYVGANTHPGIGVPITLISAELLHQRLKYKHPHKRVFILPGRSVRTLRAFFDCKETVTWVFVY